MHRFRLVAGVLALGLVANAQSAAAATGWTRVPTGLLGHQVSSLAGSPTRFVALTTTRDLLWSDDGQIWSASADHPPVSFLSQVAYGNGTFVVVGSGATLTSTDGINWSHHQTPGLQFDRLHFNGTRFIAAKSYLNSTGKGIYHSVDGVNWLPATGVPSDFSVWSIASNGAVTVASGAQSQVIRSTDGMTWTTATAGFLYGSVYWDGVSFAVASQSSGWRSLDGSDWNFLGGPPVTANVVGSATTSQGVFVGHFDGAFQASGSQLPGGSMAVNFTERIDAIAASGDRVVAAGTFGAAFLYEPGTGWQRMGEKSGLGGSATVAATAFRGGTFYAWSSGNDALNAVNDYGFAYGLFDPQWVQRSTDGVIWTKDPVTIPANLQLAGMRSNIVGFGAWLYGASQDRVLRSSDGVTWTEVAQLPWRARAFATDGTQLVAVGHSDAGGTAGFASTPDGINWTVNATLTTSAQPSFLLYTANGWWAHSSNGAKIWRSSDAVNWTESSGAPIKPTAVTAGQGRIWLRADDGALWYTTDEVTFAQVSAPLDFQSAPAWSTDRWIAAVKDYLSDPQHALAESTDGATWYIRQGTERIDPRQIDATAIGVFAFGTAGGVLRLDSPQPLPPRTTSAISMLAPIVGANPGNLVSMTGLPVGTHFLIADDRFALAPITFDGSTGNFSIEHSLSLAGMGSGWFVVVAENGGEYSNFVRIDYGAATPPPPPPPPPPPSSGGGGAIDLGGLSLLLALLLFTRHREQRRLTDLRQRGATSQQ